MSSSRDQGANRIILTAASAASLAGAANPIPLAGDVIILVGAWATMLVTLAGVYEAEFDAKSFRVAARQTLVSVGAYLFGTLSFIYVVKYTGAGTAPAAIANAVLNFGVTMAVGFLYKDAWKNNRDPSVDDLERVIRETAEVLAENLKGEQRKELVSVYKQSRKAGDTHREAVMKVIKHLFGDKYVIS